MAYTKEQLQAMKRADLQRMCKKIGIKANLKTEKMVEELVKYHSTADQNEAEKTSLSECTSNEVVVTEPVVAIEETKCDPKEPEKPSETKVLTENPPVKRKSNIKIIKPVKASKIPRLNGKSDVKNTDCKTPTTNTNGKNKTPKRTEPRDWAKIHQRQFDKMDSLDVYWSKKRKRAEDLGSGVKRVKTSTEEKPKTEVIQRPADVKSVPPKSLLTPKVVTPKSKEETLNNKKRLTFNFFPSAKENAVQTPGASKRRTTLHDGPNKPATPFRFTSNTMPFGSPTPRKKFDLQESLSKPLRYKPYTGKLPTPPYTKQTVKAVAGKTNAKKSHQRDMKAVKTKTRSDRREKQMKSQSRARESAVSRRRGLLH